MPDSAGDLFSRTLGISGVVALAFSHSHTCTLPSCVRRARQGVCGQRNKVERPRAESHQRTLLTARSSSPLSEPSLKELHTRRAPLGLGQSQVGGIQARSYTKATRSKLPICIQKCLAELLDPGLALARVGDRCDGCSALCLEVPSRDPYMLLAPEEAGELVETVLQRYQLQLAVAVKEVLVANSKGT